jgi:hypothetical protein
VSRRIRNTFLTLGAVCFLATAFGITLHLHLAHVKEPANHDAAHCSLCQQLLLSKKDYTAEIDPANIEIDSVGRLIPIRPAPLLQQTSPYQCHPRAPPT